jgi:hypothetical protein
MFHPSIVNKASIHLHKQQHHQQRSTQHLHHQKPPLSQHTSHPSGKSPLTTCPPLTEKYLLCKLCYNQHLNPWHSTDQCPFKNLTFIIKKQTRECVMQHNALHGHHNKNYNKNIDTPSSTSTPLQAIFPSTAHSVHIHHAHPLESTTNIPAPLDDSPNPYEELIKKIRYNNDPTPPIPDPTATSHHMLPV